MQALVLGYWRPETLLEELGPHDPEIHRARRDRAATAHERAMQNLLLRAHEEGRADAGKPVEEVLRRVEEEIYTKGRIG